MIGFLHPWLLAGLAAAGVPLLLHLIARRDPPTVEFPAVRYLMDVTREHSRRLKLRNWLLLLLRTLLIAVLVLAAAGPSAAIRQAGSHGPTALVVILDDSPSSGAIVDGTPRLTELRAAARHVLERATPEDALWLLAADGVPRRGDGPALIALVDSLKPSSLRLDIGAALNVAGGILAVDKRPGAITLISDVQASAVSPAAIRVPLLVIRPDAPATPNSGIARLDPGPQPWTTDGGAVSVTVTGDSGRTVPVSVRLGEHLHRQALAAIGGSATFSLPGIPAGWWPLRAELDPDELRTDDERIVAVRVAPVARVSCPRNDRFLQAACDVLLRNGRIQAGSDVTLGTLGEGASVVFPPDDPAELGALNRALARRGVRWAYGALAPSAATTDSGALIGREPVTRRYTLVRLEKEDTLGGVRGVVATAGGTPWIVRDANVVLLGSRLDPAWTGLPLSARFMPFVDALLNRLARGEVQLLNGAPGAPVMLPDLITQVVEGGRRWPVEGGAAFRPPVPGLYFLLAGVDTAGVLAVNIDPRESRLAMAPDAQLRQLWPTASISGLRASGEMAYTGAGRADLRGLFLWSALLLGVMEVAVASGGGRAE
ncbi:MAG: BatA and WFA domain-containing protein [Gemmatimonadota bacterium]